MFTTERMTKIRITGSQTQLPSVVELLYSLQLMHLLDHKKTEALDIGSPFTDSEQISTLLLQVRSLLATFPATVLASVSSLHAQQKPHLDHVQHELSLVSAPLAAAQQHLTSLQSTLSEKKYLSKHLQLLGALHLSPDALAPYKSIASFIGTVSSDQQLSSSLLAVAPEAYVRSTLHDTMHFVAVFVPHTSAAAVHDVLQKYNYKPYSFPQLSSFSHDAAAEAKKLLVTVGLLEKDLAHAEKELLRLQTMHATSLVAMESFLAAALAKAQAPLRFAETKHAFFIEGWVSAQEYQRLKQGLEKETHHKIHLEVLEIMKSDKIPIILKNSFFVKPFEFFLHLYTLPSYKEMDPSFFIFFSFPFFFGLMLGDVGYGLVTLLLFALLWWKMPSGRNLLTVMMVSAVVSIFFGVLFGEYFGFEHVSEHTGKILAEQYGLPLHAEILHDGETVYSFPRIMNRLHGEVEIVGNTLPMVLVLGAILGFIHVNFGLFLGFINEVISHGFMHAFYAKISWYILELGIALLALSGLGLIPLPLFVGFAVVVLSAVLLFIGEGVQGLVEIPSIMTNILSYLRLGAVGLSSVGLAVVINENLALPFMEKGGIYFVLALFILIIGHLINIALGVIGPFLHAMRLHYVEFFSKFYKGGGIPFIAFGSEKEK